MSEHRKIPLPGEGKSLFERAEGALGGFDTFTPAPVPDKLAGPTNRRWKKPEAKPRAVEIEVAPESPSRLLEGPGEGQPEPGAAIDRPTPDPSREREGCAVAPAAAPVEPITFTAKPQPIDRAHLSGQGLIVPGGPVTALMEEFRIVKRQLLVSAAAGRSGPDAAKAQRVLVCSPLPGEGKTFCATNLALAIAGERDSEVLLVDADFAKPSILSLLGLTGEKGLMDALADPTIAVEDCVVSTDVPGLYVLPAGNRTASDSEYLSSARTAAVLARLTQGAPQRMVIFDSPPALAASPAAELAKYAGQALVICRADQTGQTGLEDALSLLSACPDIKLLLNAANFSPSGRRFGDYYGYGG